MPKPPFVLSSLANPVRSARGYCVPPGLPDSVIVVAEEKDNVNYTEATAVYRYDSGVAVTLPKFSAVGYMVTSLDIPYNIVLSPRLLLGNAATGAILATKSNYVGNAVFYRDGRLYDTGVFTANYPSEDLLYDPVRDRLLLSVSSSLSGQTNGLVVLNPFTGVGESFTPLGKRPAKLARSDDGQFLYLSFPDSGLVRQLNLPALSTQTEFSAGPGLYASDLAVVPGAPQSVVAARV